MFDPVDLDTLPNDKFGYRIYGVMAHATPEQHRIVRRFHEAIGLRDFATQAHVSAHESFFGIEGLDEVKARVRSIAETTPPFRIEFALGGCKHFSRAKSFGVLEVKESPALVTLNRSLVEGLDPIVKTSSSPGRKFWPHLTLYLDANEEEAARARKLAAAVDLGQGYEVASIELIGRVGPTRGGEYKIIESFLLKGGLG